MRVFYAASIAAILIVGSSLTAGCSNRRAPVPTQAEALAAVRRHQGPIAPPLDQAAVTLGPCAADAGLARCTIDLICDPRRSSRSQRRVVAFARLAGAWEVAIW